MCASLELLLYILTQLSKCNVLVEYEILTHYTFKNILGDIFCCRVGHDSARTTDRGSQDFFIFCNTCPIIFLFSATHLFSKKNNIGKKNFSKKFSKKNLKKIFFQTKFPNNIFKKKFQKKKFSPKKFSPKNFHSKKCSPKKYHPQKFHPKFSLKKIFTQKIFTQIVRLSFVDLR